MSNTKLLANIAQEVCQPILDRIPQIVAVSIEEFLQMDFPRPENIIEPWMPKGGSAMVFAERGVGKTFFALEIMIAAATGGNYLAYHAPRPIKVLYIDGEMNSSDMQSRIKEILSRTNHSHIICPTLITSDLQGEFMLDLNTSEGREALRSYIKEAELIILDNLSTLSSAKENDADAWADMQRFILQIKRMRKSVILIHHTNKNGGQRGTSRHEDILDTVLRLEHPADYKNEDGACFEIHYDKARHIYGDQVQPILCTKSEDGWKYSKVRNEMNQAIIDGKNKGLNQKEIASLLNVAESTISKRTKKLREEGEIL